MTKSQFIQDNFAGVPFRPDRLSALNFSMVKSDVAGFIAEFGVARGETLNFLADLTDETIYGFDSFAGLPADWQKDFGVGAFAVLDRRELRFALNTRVYEGLFLETLPRFLNEVEGIARFIHIDCDLGSSALQVLEFLAPRIVKGTVIQFDELFGYEGFEQHEWGALNTFCARFGRSFDFLCWTGGEQAAVRFS